MIFMNFVLLNNNKPDSYSHNLNDDCGSQLGVKEDATTLESESQH